MTAFDDANAAIDADDEMSVDALWTFQIDPDHPMPIRCVFQQGTPVARRVEGFATAAPRTIISMTYKVLVAALEARMQESAFGDTVKVNGASYEVATISPTAFGRAFIDLSGPL